MRLTDEQIEEARNIGLDWIREDPGKAIETIDALAQDLLDTRAALRNARSYIPQSGLVDHADLLAEIDSLLDEREDDERQDEEVGR